MTLLNEISDRKRQKKMEKWASKNPGIPHPYYEQSPLDRVSSDYPLATVNKPQQQPKRHAPVEIDKSNREDIRTLLEFLNMPVGSMDPVFAKFESLPGAITRGAGDEKFVYVPGSRENRVMLVAHADTVWDGMIKCGSKNRIMYESGIFSSNIPGCGIGADDRAGCAMVWLMRDSGHSLLITGGEETGGIASNFIVNSNPDISGEINKGHAFVVQLDRRNAKDFKCYNVGSKDFRSYVTKTLGDYAEPDRGSFTDIGYLCEDVCGVNLSVGYYHEHTDSEYLVVSEWLNTLQHVRKWLSQPNLPKCMQDEEEKEARKKASSWKTYVGSFGDWDWSKYATASKARDDESPTDYGPVYDKWIKKGRALMQRGFRSRKEAEDFFVEYRYDDFTSEADQKLYRFHEEDWVPRKSDEESYREWLRLNSKHHEGDSGASGNEGFSLELVNHHTAKEIEAAQIKLQQGFYSEKEAAEFFAEYDAEEFDEHFRTSYWYQRNKHEDRKKLPNPDLMIPKMRKYADMYLRGALKVEHLEAVDSLLRRISESFTIVQSLGEWEREDYNMLDEWAEGMRRKKKDTKPFYDKDIGARLHIFNDQFLGGLEDYTPQPEVIEKLRAYLHSLQTSGKVASLDQIDHDRFVKLSKWLVTHDDANRRANAKIPTNKERIRLHKIYTAIRKWDAGETKHAFAKGEDVKDIRAFLISLFDKELNEVDTQKLDYIKVVFKNHDVALDDDDS